jgi:hypothetical protein
MDRNNRRHWCGPGTQATYNILCDGKRLDEALTLPARDP